MRNRLVGVDVLRAVSILMVLAAHWPLRGKHPPGLVDYPFLSLAARGTYGVTIFFAISGFLITRTIMARNANIYRLSLYDFWTRRVARIWPLLLASILIGAIALSLGSRNSVFSDSKALPFDAMFWASLFTFTFNWLRVFYANIYHVGGWGLHWDVMWSLAVEEQFYLFLPLALIACRNKSRTTALLVLVIVVGVLSRYLIARANLFMGGYMSFARFDALALGVLAALYAPRLPRSLAFPSVAAGLILLVIGCRYYELVFPPFVQAAGAAIFMLGAQARDDLFGTRWNGFARIGTLSYEIYLLHPLVYEMLKRWVTPDLGGIGLSFGYLAYVAACIVVAEIVHRGFTEPANMWLRDHFRKFASGAVLSPVIESP